MHLLCSHRVQSFHSHREQGSTPSPLSFYIHAESHPPPRASCLPDRGHSGEGRRTIWPPFTELIWTLGLTLPTLQTRLSVSGDHRFLPQTKSTAAARATAAFAHLVLWRWNFVPAGLWMLWLGKGKINVLSLHVLGRYPALHQLFSGLTQSQ